MPRFKLMRPVAAALCLSMAWMAPAWTKDSATPPSASAAASTEVKPPARPVVAAEKVKVAPAASSVSVATPASAAQPDKKEAEPAKKEDEAKEASDGEQDILQYLDQVITWQRGLSTLLPFSSNPRGQLLKQTLQQNANQALRLAFDFARARAPAVPAKPADASADTADNSHAQAMAKSAEIDQRVASLEAELKQPYIGKKNAAARKKFDARKELAASQLNFAKAQQELLHTIIGFWKTGTTSELSQQIDELARTIPELQDAKPASTATIIKAKGDAETNVVPDSNGLFDLGQQLYGYSRKKSELEDLLKLSKALQDTNSAEISWFRGQLKAAAERSDEIAGSDFSEDPAIQAARRKEMDELVEQFKTLAKIVTPLSEETVWVDAAANTLRDWRATVQHDIEKLVRRLAVRLSVLGGVILVTLLVAEFARRATQRYIRDPRRRRQLHIIRRVIVGFFVFLTILLSLVTEFGSLATFAGFLTAGLAVALQNVILSAVAYFFYFNRYGVRVGSRVSVAGVTGDVAEIGLLRLYLIELAGDSLSLHPTGRIVAFPNSVLFQPTAFFRQLPGTDYAWHELGLTFSEDTDPHEVEVRLDKIVDDTFAQYSEMAGRQQVLEHFTQTSVAALRPEKVLRWTAEGLVYTVRYPVEGERGVEFDKLLLQTLRDAVTTGTPLQLLSSSIK